MLSAAENLEFEEAGRLRDRIQSLESGAPPRATGAGKRRRGRARRR